jgi:hypothetical protein
MPYWNEVSIPVRDRPGALAGEQAGVGGFAIRDRRTRQLASEQFASPGTDGKHVALRVQNEIVQWDTREEPTIALSRSSVKGGAF